MKGKSLTIVFDFDGTVADTFPHFKYFFNELSKEFNFPEVGDKEWEWLREEKTKEIFKKMGISLLKVPEIIAKSKEIMAKRMKEILGLA